MHDSPAVVVHAGPRQAVYLESRRGMSAQLDCRSRLMDLVRSQMTAMLTWSPTTVDRRADAVAGTVDRCADAVADTVGRCADVVAGTAEAEPGIISVRPLIDLALFA